MRRRSNKQHVLHTARGLAIVLALGVIIGALYAFQQPVAPVSYISPPTTDYSLSWSQDIPANVTRYNVRYNEKDPWVNIGKLAGTAPQVKMPVLTLGSYIARVQACDVKACYDSDPMPFTVAAPRPNVNLPEPWQSRDIGFTGQLGVTRHSAGVFTLEAGGQDIWGTTDSFRYLYQTLPDGDASMTVHIGTFPSTGEGWNKGGLMMRAALTDTGSPMAMITALGNSRYIQLMYRTSLNAAATSQDVSSSAFAIKPTWFRITRTGQVITGDYSIDGRTWTPVGKITLANLKFIGVALSANSTTALNTSTFDSIAFTGVQPRGGPPATPGNVILSGPPTR